MGSGVERATNILLIIDPQNDFHPGGTLGVPGANEDSARVAAFIKDNVDHIDEIYVSLDSHHRIHIAHGVFWQDPSGAHPSPFTLIKSVDVEQGAWTPVDPAHLEHAKRYTRALEDKGRFVLCVWPEHCLIGTPGHAVVPGLNDALQDWVKAKMRPVSYIHKGIHCLTEMYSAMAAEVPMDDDPSTALNTALMDRLRATSRLFVCGQAKSHCVNYTMRDIAAHWNSDPAQLVLLEDCCSAVPGFEAAAEQFVSDMKAQGCTVLQAADVTL
jgi:nicotinamidase-related amidase